MDQHQNGSFCRTAANSALPLADAPTSRSQSSNSESRQRPDEDGKDPVAARKVQKADREKLRRDRLNEHFMELGNAVDPERPKNDKATILTDTIQLLKDLTSEVNRLKAECATLSEESHELTQEKNELREEKASLKSDIDNLNVQYQQRMRVMFPWAPVDPSVVMAPPYSYPVPLAVPSSPMPMHPNVQPFPFFGSQNPNAVPNHRPTFVSYPAPPNPQAEQQSYVSPSHPSSRQDSRRSQNFERSDESNDVATDLELKTPGSTGHQEMSSVNRKGKKKEKAGTDGGSSSRLSSSLGPGESTSNSIIRHE
ncbi:hypothetical protein V2J09_009560 [Rumex salicifolius]